MSNPNFKPRNKSALCDRETLIKTLNPFQPQRVMAHWYSPFLDSGSTKGRGFKTQWCAGQTPDGRPLPKGGLPKACQVD
jgi:hypothetical protein